MTKRLVDAEKLLDRLECEKFYWFGREERYGDGHYDAYSNLAKAVESGAFDNDAKDEQIESMRKALQQIINATKGSKAYSDGAKAHYIAYSTLQKLGGAPDE